MKKFSAVIYSVLVIVLSLFTILPLFHGGFFNFHDNTQVVRVVEMGNSLSAGMFPVRWVQDLGYGYGYPIFNFYGPLPYYLGGIFLKTGFDPLLATKVMFFVGIIFSGVSMFLLSRRIFGDVTGIVAGVLYTYFPYHAVNIYVRGAVGEFFAYAFLPMLLLGIVGLMQSEQKKLLSSKNITNILISAWGIFLVATSHNLTLFMFLLLFVPIIISGTVIAKYKKIFFLGTICSFLLGIMLSAFYILPAFFEMRYTNVSSQIGGGADFRDHFVCISQYWNSMWGYGGSTKGCVDGLSFKLGKLNILLFFSSLLLLGYSMYKRKWKTVEKISAVVITLFVISVFFTLEVSQWVWNTVPYMQYLQYPWRFINFIGLFMIFMIGYLFFRIEELLSRRGALAAAGIVIAITIISNYKLFEPQQYVNLPVQHYTSDDYVKYTVSNISDEYMPPSFSKPRSVNEVPKSELVFANTVGSIQLIENKANYLKSAFEIEKDGVLHINRAYFPAWKAYENGNEIPIVPTHNGMNISLHKGRGIIELKFRQTAIEVTANIVTVIALMLSVLALIRVYLPANKRKKTV